MNIRSAVHYQGLTAGTIVMEKPTMLHSIRINQKDGGNCVAVYLYLNENECEYFEFHNVGSIYYNSDGGENIKVIAAPEVPVQEQQI